MQSEKMSYPETIKTTKGKTMSSHKHHEHMQQIKERIKIAPQLSEAEKSATVKHLEEWIAEDKAEGILYEELLEISQGIKPILAELGLI